MSSACKGLFKPDSGSATGKSKVEQDFAGRQTGGFSPSNPKDSKVNSDVPLLDFSMHLEIISKID